MCQLILTKLFEGSKKIIDDIKLIYGDCLEVMQGMSYKKLYKSNVSTFKR